MRSIRVWQWRWMNSKTKKPFGGHWSLLEEAQGDVRGKNIAHLFKNKFPVNYRTSSKKHFKFPGNLKPILGNESVVSLWRKRHFFQNVQNAGAVFPPTGSFCSSMVRKRLAFNGIYRYHYGGPSVSCIHFHT